MYTAQTGPATITTPNGTAYTSTTPTGTTKSITPHGAVSASSTTTTTTTISTTLHGTFSAFATPMGTSTITTPYGLFPLTTVLSLLLKLQKIRLDQPTKRRRV